MSTLTESQKDKVIEKYAEAQEAISEPTKVFTYFFDESGKEQIETYKKKQKAKKNRWNHELNKDEEYTEDEEIDTGHIKLSFPKPPLQGESESMILYMRNNLRSMIELEPYTMDKHLTITEYPRFLKSKEIGRIRLTFSPSFKRFEALNEDTGQWGFNYEIYTR